jgi:mRNA interferase MazF
MTIQSKRIPEAGDLVWVNFDPVRGSEQAGARPALVLSDATMHQVCRLAIICPVTSNVAPWPAKVLLPDGLSVKGAIMVDQVRSVDRTQRGFRFIDRVPEATLFDARTKLATLIGVDLTGP